MKKKLNTVFFSLFFLCSVVAEAYFIRTSSGDYVSVIGIGIVLLISGYLLMDSIRSKLAEQGKGIRSYVDRMYQEETQRRTEQLTELINLQKATYMATKKNTSAITDQLAQLEELLERVEGLERENGKVLEGLEILQKKSLEGQRNALNLEINYSKENTKQLMRVLREVGAQEETRELLNRIAECIEKNTVELRKELQNVSITTPSSSGNEGPIKGIGQDWDLEDSSWNGDSYDGLLREEERKDEKQISTGWGWEEAAVTEALSSDTITEVQPEDADWFQEEKTPDTISSGQEELISEADEITEEIAVNAAEQAPVSIPEIIPLYDDPNKALSADEIARLFASLGQ